MIGSGFIKDMINVARSNRRLLKGEDQPTYKNFDKSYITNTIISRKAPVFKKATPEYLERIRRHYVGERKREAKIKLVVLIISILSAFFLFYIILTAR